MSPTRVVVICPMPPLQSPEADHAYHQARGLAARGVDVHVIAQKGSIAPAVPGLTIHPLMENWNWREQSRLLRAVRQIAPDAVLLNYIGYLYGFEPMVTYLPTLLKRILPNTLFVTQISNTFGTRDMGHNLPGRLAHKIVRAVLGGDFGFGTLLQGSGRVIILSESHRQILTTIDAGAEAKSVLIPPPVIMPLSPDANGETRRREREKLGVGPGETLLAYFGYLYPKKGLETLLRAFALLRARQAPVRLALIGGVPEAAVAGADYRGQLETLAAELEITKRVTFTGGFAWDSDQGSASLRAADIATLPFDDGARLNNSSLAAAAAHGLPLVTTQAVEMEAPFVPGETVFLCPPQNPAALADAIEAVMRDAALRERLRQGAQRLAAEWFSTEGATDKLLAALTPGENAPK